MSKKERKLVNDGEKERKQTRKVYVSVCERDRVRGREYVKEIDREYECGSEKK